MQNYLVFISLYGDRSGWSFFRPEERGQRNRFQSDAWMWPFSLPSFYRFLCSYVTYPRCFFSMDNLRGYGEDEPSSSSRLGPSSQELPASSAGSATLPTSQVPVMAGTPSAIVSVTLGPVPPVSARFGSSLSGSKDSVTPSRDTHDDLLPPPPPSEPYEVFLARVGRATLNTSGPATQPAAAARLSVSVTTGNRLPTPFPTYEDSSWMHQSQVQASRIRMPLPASFYTAPPSPWVWPGRGSTIATSVIRTYQPVSSAAALAGHPGSIGHFPGGPTPVPPPHKYFLRPATVSRKWNNTWFTTNILFICLKWFTNDFYSLLIHYSWKLSVNCLNRDQ